MRVFPVVAGWCLALMACLVSPARAAESRSFVIGGQAVVLADVSATTEVYLSSMRRDAERNRWVFEVRLRNTAIRPLTGPVVLVAEALENAAGFPESDGSDGSGRPWFGLSDRLPSGGLGTGEYSGARTLVMDGTRGAPRVTWKVFGPEVAEGPPLALVRTLAADGTPLPGVLVTAEGPGGSGSSSTDAESAVATLGQGAGLNVLRFEAEGHLPVWRLATLVPGSVLEVPSPRLTLRDTNVLAVPDAGGTVTNGTGAVRVTFAAAGGSGSGRALAGVGRMDGARSAVVTLVGAQALPALLPAGWSPLQAFWLEVQGAGGGGRMGARLELWEALTVGSTGVLVRWDAQTLRWIAVDTEAGLGSAVVEVTLDAPGAFALVVPDDAPNAPGNVVLGAALPGVDGVSPDWAAVSAWARAIPESRPASEVAALVTGLGEIVVSNRLGSLPSGTLLRATVQERYEFRDGTVRATPGYETYISGFQRPGDRLASTLRATLPLRPQVLLDSGTLSVARVQVDVYPPTQFGGAVLGVDGGAVTNGRVRILAGVGVVGRAQAVRLAGIPVETFVGLNTNGMEVVTAFEWTAGGLQPGARLTLEVTGLEVGGHYLLVRAGADGVDGLEPRERYRVDGGGRLVSLEPGSEPRLPGLGGSGKYGLVRVPAGLALVTGVVRGGGGVVLPGWVVRSGAWRSRTDAGGRYRLVAFDGPALVEAWDGRTGLSVRGSVVVTGGGGVTTLDLDLGGGGPRVVGITPRAGATNVAWVTPVEVLFSRSLNAASVLGGAVRLLDPTNQVVAAAVSLNLRGDQVSLLPDAPLRPGARYAVVLSESIVDRAGRGLEGDREFAFTTVPAVPVVPGGASLTSFEPVNGQVRIEGGAGFAESGRPVVLVNETTGRTVTVLAGVDGSFSGSIAASADDELSITTVNANGTATSVPVGRQVFADGSVVLSAAGGMIRVDGEHGPIDFMIEPGSTGGRTRFRFESVPLAEAVAEVGNQQPEGGRILGGVRVFAIQGPAMSRSMDVAFPVDVADMGLPDGVSPEECSFGLAIARRVDDEPVFELIDRMHYEDGRLVTHSPPFFGLLGPFEDILVLPLLMFTAEVPMLVNGTVYAAEVDPATGRPLAGATREVIAGAIVSGQGKTAAPGLRGRLRPGTVYAVSGPDGRYTLMVNADPLSAAKPVAVVASHPRFPGQRPASLVPDLSAGERLAIGNLLTQRDIVFPRSGGALDVTPTLSPSHVPLFPAVSADAVLTVLAQDDTTVPFVQASIAGVSMLDGQPASVADATLAESLSESVGSTARRVAFTVRSTRAQVVNVRLRASDDNGNERTLLYPIAFGALPPPTGEDLPPSDALDDAGPYVVGVEPAPGARSLVPGQPIVLRFNEPIRRDTVSAPRVVTLEPDGGPCRLELSADQRELTLHFPTLRPGTAHTLTLGFGVRDLAGNVLDQRPSEPGNQSYVFPFSTAPVQAVGLDSVIGRDSGAGAVFQGNFALIAERRGADRGRVVVLDVSAPMTPRVVEEIGLPSFPREMLLIPRYAYAYTNGLPAADGGNPIRLAMFTQTNHPGRLNRTNDLLVVAGGLAGQGQLQWLRVYDVTDPRRPGYVAGAVIGINGLFLPGRMRWTAPSLAYLETGLPDRLSVVNLQAFIIADLLSTNQDEYRKLPDEDGTPGRDLNGDGDYVDPGETLPLPGRLPAEYGGKEFALALPDTDQQIIDFAAEDGGAFLGVIVSDGRVLGQDGRPRDDQPAPAAFRVLLDQGLMPPRQAASHEFPPSRRPRRVETLFGHPMAGSQGVALRDLVLVTLRGNAAAGETNNFLAVLDITDRLAITRVTEVPLPRDVEPGNVYGVRRLDDGLLAVMGERSAYLVDPRRFTDAPGVDGRHPALVGTVEGWGGSARLFDALPSGLHVTADAEGQARLIQTAPTLAFVGWSGGALVDPAALAGRPAADVEGLLDSVERRSFLRPAWLRGARACDPGRAEDLDPANHHYVLVQAPGGAGPTLELALESTGWSGYPLRKRGFLFPPVHALGAGALADLGQEPGPDDAPVRTLRAHRLSDDPTSSLYHFYLSRPFVLLLEGASTAELAALKAARDREFLWSGHGVRAGLDPSMSTNAAVGMHAGRVDLVERVVRPGASAVARAFPGDLIPSPNPGPVTGEMLLPLAMNAVGAHNSELTLNATDMAWPGRRLPFEFRRTYRGQSLYDGVFGRGWDFGFNQRVVEFPVWAVGSGGCVTWLDHPDADEREVLRPGDLVFHTGGGQTVLFRDAGTNAPPEIAADPLFQQLGWAPLTARYYLPPPGLFAPMVKFRDGRYARLEPDGTRYLFNPAGRLERIYDRFDKNFIELVYGERGELLRILDDRRQALDIGYFRVFSDPLFRAGVDERATQVTDIGRVARLKDHSGRDVRYRYSADGLLLRWEGPEVTTGPADSFKGRQQVNYTYTDASQPERSGKSLVGLTGGDVGGSPVLAVAAQSGRGRDTVARMQWLGREVTIEQPHANSPAGLAAGVAPTVVTSPDGTTASVRFDRAGRVTEAVLAGGAGGSSTNRQEYHTSGPLRGLVKATISPLGDRTEFVYDEAHPSLRSRGNLRRIRKIPGPRGGPVLEAGTEYDPLHNLPAGLKTDFNGVATEIVLATDRRSVERIVRGGERELFTVNEFGQPDTRTAIDGTFTRFSYDARGYLSAREDGGLQTRFLYTPIGGGASDPGLRGRPSFVIDPSEVSTRFVHDELDRLVEEEREGLRITSSFDATGNLVRKVTQATRDRAAIEEFVWQSHGFLSEHRLLNVEVGNGLADLVTSYERDPMNRPTRVTFPSGEVREFLYDDLGRIREERVPGSSTNRFEYDPAGNLTLLARGGAEERYEYDGHDRQVRAIGANGSVAVMGYDPNGNLTTNRFEAADGTRLAEVRFEYDALNRLRRRVLSRNDGESVVTTDYRSGDRSVTVTDARGASVTSRVDPSGRTTRVEAPAHVLDLVRDRLGNIVARRVTDAGGVFETGFAFDTRNQIVAVTNSLGAVARYDLDLDGRQLQAIDREGGVTTNAFSLLGEVLASSRPSGVAEHRRFDAGRNVVRVEDAAGNGIGFDYDANNRLTAKELPNGQRSELRGYDAFGNATVQDLPRGVQVRTHHDFEGKLTNRVVTSAAGTRSERFTYDGLRRYRRVEDPSGSVEFDYDLAGFIRETRREVRFSDDPAPRAPLAYRVRQGADPALFRTRFEYPVDGRPLLYDRDLPGRLVALRPEGAEPVITTNLWVGDTRYSARILGQDRIRLDLAFDALPRIVGRRYTRLRDGVVLVDVRQDYDANGGVRARQWVHRGGRTELFHYDDGYRLTRVDYGARPRMAGETAAPVLLGFTIPDGLAGAWQSGFAARVASYSDTDALTALATSNPLGLPIPPMPSTYEALDGFLCVTRLDGFERQVDGIGNVTRTRLAVRLPGEPLPALVAADLEYNDLGQLVRVEREDGVVIRNEYDMHGLRVRRSVVGPGDRCVPSDIAFLYDGLRLIEERDLAAGGALLRRYYYTDDGDELVAAEARASAAGTFERFYYLTDNQRSVVAVADQDGDVRQRVWYDAWGQPVIEQTDAAAPEVHAIHRTADGLRITFSEPVLPPVGQGAGAGGAAGGILRELPSLAGRVTVRSGGVPATVRVEPADDAAASGFGSAFQVVSEGLSGVVEVEVVGGAWADEWGNTNRAATVVVDLAAPAGAELFAGAGAGSTAARVSGRSRVGGTILFHGQVYDEDTGLLYCRARHYDPHSGTFLQRDPAGYTDGVNPYAAFAHNPVSHRDPTGASVLDDLRQMGETLQEDADRHRESGGFVNLALSMVEEGFAGLLQMPAATRDGWNLLNSESQGGTLDLLNRMKAAEVVGRAPTAALGVAAGTYGAVRSLRTVTGFLAQRAQGLGNAVTRRARLALGRGRAEDFLFGQGTSRAEAEAFVNTMAIVRDQYKADQVEAAVRGFGKKKFWRRHHRESGMATKTEWAKTKTGRKATLELELVAPNGTVTRRTVTGDLDFYYIKVNGRLLEEHEVQRFKQVFNREFARAWKRQGGTEWPGVSMHHGAHLNLPELIGNQVNHAGAHMAAKPMREEAGSAAYKLLPEQRVARYDMDLLGSIKGPGPDAFAVRIDAAGRVQGFNPSPQQLRIELDHVARRFRDATGIELGTYGWYRDFPIPGQAQE